MYVYNYVHSSSECNIVLLLMKKKLPEHIVKCLQAPGYDVIANPNTDTQQRHPEILTKFTCNSFTISLNGSKYCSTLDEGQLHLQHNYGTSSLP